jgi:hypothetical protein
VITNRRNKMKNKTQTHEVRAPVEGEKPLPLEGGKENMEIDNGRDRYNRARERLWEVLEQNRSALVIPELRDPSGKIAFPYDAFCKANPSVRELAKQVQDELHYELSENQASWAVMKFITQTNAADTEKWIAEPKKHLLKVQRIGNNGRTYSRYQEYEPNGRYSTEINLALLPEDRELRVTPHTSEHLQRSIKEVHREYVIDRLFAIIHDDRQIASLGLFWNFSLDGTDKIVQYGFEDDIPAGYNLGIMSGPGLPTCEKVAIDSRLARHFEGLKIERPQAAASLDACLSHLTRRNLDSGRD